jgi:anti-sigma regulatory factor (Ser/Thr protein kinase)
MVARRAVFTASIGLGGGPSVPWPDWLDRLLSELVAEGPFVAATVPDPRVFPGTPDQVAAVRRFVRAQLGAHPALDDSVLVASELAANAIAHTASGLTGGAFVVRIASLSPEHVAVLVVDGGADTEPRALETGVDSESGRGLDVVKGLATAFWTTGPDGQRAVLAVIPPSAAIEAWRTA